MQREKGGARRGVRRVAEVSGRAGVHVDGREERGERTARELLGAARRRFAEGGYRGTSLRDVAGDVGANVALIRYHFGSKAGLYERVIDEAMGPLRERLAAAFVAEGTLTERVQRAAGAYLDHLASDRDFPRLVQRALLDGDEPILRVGREHLRPLYELLRAFVPADEERLGRIEDAVVTLFGALAAPVLYGPLLEAVFGHEPLGRERLERRKKHVEALVELVLRNGIVEPEQDGDRA
jgi:TetR/AcrR family transcriptional regulator